MTAYGALLSLKNTIHYILNSQPSLHIIQLAYNELQPLQEILQRLDGTSPSKTRKKVNALDGQIKDTLWAMEDKLESHILSQILPDQVDGGVNQSRSSAIDLQEDVDSFIHTLDDLKRKYIYEVENMGDECVSSRIGFGGTKSKMIGLSDEFEIFKTRLMGSHRRKNVWALVGMAGIGKTTLAKEIFEDPQISSHYEYQAGVTVGRNPQLTQLSRAILAQLTQGDEDISEGKSCLIVLDDVWEKQVLDLLISSLPNINNGVIQILVTTRDGSVIGYHDGFLTCTSEVRFLDDQESKDLLCHKVFGEETCPPQLDKAATKIAKNCEGLPLTILTVAHYLSQNRDPEYWNDVAEKRNSVFTNAYDQISKVLFPSYDYLPQCLKMPFLYMGVFPSDYDFPPSKIISMLTAEGWFLDTSKTLSLEASVWQCLHELCISKILVLFNRKSIFWDGGIYDHIYKTCRLHSSWRHVCRGEAQKNKFYHVLNRLADGLEEGVKGQRGLCLENNMLFGIKEFCNLVRLNCASSTRSLLFYGPYHPYPVPIDVGFKLLRELDALQLRFYTFPTQILTLVQLKYLALTCNKQVPATISKLFNLRTLIIHPHVNVRCCRAPSYVPVQIWDMQELEHIEILGKSLVAPDHVVSLEKLSTLVGMNTSICTILRLSKRIPNIKKLGIQLELTPCDDHNDILSCFGCISTLGSLRTLKCSIINPMLKSGHGHAISATPSSLMLALGLKKLHLSGMGFPWEYMDVIGSLENLQVLKLRSYAFRGPTWEAQELSFLRLKFLLIEDSDLVQWKPRFRSFFSLSYLSLKHCYQLKELHWTSHSVFGKIELVDCNPLAVTCANQLQPRPRCHLDVIASSHFDEKPITTNLQRYGTADEDTNDEYEKNEEEDDEDLSDWEEDDDEDLSNREDDDDEDLTDKEEDDDEDLSDWEEDDEEE
ncbi:putative late blight resistance protein homolog R1A-10 [Salvia miltiorrhiza]|uniref:putative late blight resistance protein homolog R1A-10 n=1 Tax=Salvia miltiorrhiza TaxID=226208 RepID=UPI0025AC288F|nr:putative late blight resistance protein homolog R1A-10 [Salvia miltiorrhiza]